MGRLRFPLAPHDQLVFLHIPKTGGTTLFEILRRFFPPEQTVSIPMGGLANEAYVETLRNASLSRGHFGYEVYQYFVRPPVFITMLRNPLDRVVSHYVEMKRITSQRPIPFSGTLDEFVRNEAPDKQTRMIAGRNLKFPITSPETCLAVAKAHLVNFPYFGITERFEESLRLLTYIFGWEPIVDYKIRNKSNPEEMPEVTEEIRQQILEKNKLDQQLYEFALKIFEERLEVMNKELG